MLKYFMFMLKIFIIIDMFWLYCTTCWIIWSLNSTIMSNMADFMSSKSHPISIMTHIFDMSGCQVSIRTRQNLRICQLWSVLQILSDLQISVRFATFLKKSQLSDPRIVPGRVHHAKLAESRDPAQNGQVGDLGANRTLRAKKNVFWTLPTR